MLIAAKPEGGAALYEMANSLRFHNSKWLGRGQRVWVVDGAKCSRVQPLYIISGRKCLSSNIHSVAWCYCLSMLTKWNTWGELGNCGREGRAEQQKIQTQNFDNINTMDCRIMFFLFQAPCSVWFSSIFSHLSFPLSACSCLLSFPLSFFLSLSPSCPHPLFINSLSPKEYLNSNFSLAFHPALPHILSC